MAELVNPQYIEDFLNQKIQQNNFSNNIQRNKVENQIVSDFKQNVHENKNNQKQNNLNQEDTKTKSSVFFDKLQNDPQQISYYRNNPSSIPYIQSVNNNQKVEQQLYSQFRDQQNSQPNMSIPYQQYSLYYQDPEKFINQLNNQQLENKQLPKVQNSNLQIDQQNMKGDKQQIQFNNNRPLSDEDSQKKIYFQQLVEQCEKVNDAISEITMLLTKWKFLSIEGQFSPFQGVLFRYYYQSQKQGIPRIYSETKSTKKAAQHDAARKFLPHILYFLKFQKAYFENNEEEKEYLFQRANTANVSNKIEKTQFDADQELLLNFQDDVQAVYLQIQSHERTQLQEVLRVDESQKEGEFFKCEVQFWKNGEAVFTTEGLGGSKKAAKNVAFMKINPLVQKYYDPSKSVENLLNIHNKKPVQRRDFDVNDDDIDY